LIKEYVRIEVDNKNAAAVLRAFEYWRSDFLTPSEISNYLFHQENLSLVPQTIYSALQKAFQNITGVLHEQDYGRLAEKVDNSLKTSDTLGYWNPLLFLQEKEEVAKIQSGIYDLYRNKLAWSSRIFEFVHTLPDTHDVVWRNLQGLDDVSTCLLDPKYLVGSHIPLAHNIRAILLTKFNGDFFGIPLNRNQAKLLQVYFFDKENIPLEVPVEGIGLSKDQISYLLGSLARKYNDFEGYTAGTISNKHDRNIISYNFPYPRIESSTVFDK
jgi:hypothetical protein